MKVLILTLASVYASTVAFAQPERPDPVRTLIDWNGHEVAEGQVLIQFVSETPAYAQRDLVAQVPGSEVLETTSDLVLLVTVPEGQTIDDTISRYKQFDDVELAEPNRVFYPLEVPDDPHWDDQWALSFMNADDAWDKFTGDSDYIVAVVDTGVLFTHDDLDGVFIGGWDYYAEDANPTDLFGHGTLACGIAAAETNNGELIASSGRNVSLLAYRAGDGPFLANDLVQSIIDAKNRGAHVQNYSWGSPVNSEILEAAITAFCNAGGVAVAACGNFGNTWEFYPAALDNVIAVAAHTPDGSRWSHSSYGDWVSVAAGGTDILSTYIDSDTSLIYRDGTSMASPHVAGMATALYALHGGPRLRSTAHEVRRVIEETCEDVDWVEFGRVNMHAAFCEMERGDPPGDCVDPVAYGDSTLGGGGVAPRPGFEGGWPSFGNEDFKITCYDARANTSGLTFIGFGRENFDNGLFTLNVSLAGPPAAIIRPTSYDAIGYSELIAPIPDVPSIGGLQVNVQFLAMDPDAPTGVSATRGIEFFVCDPNG